MEKQLELMIMLELSSLNYASFCNVYFNIYFMKNIKNYKKYNEAISIGGKKKEELDLEYVTNCLIDLIEIDNSKVYYKYQYKKYDRWLESDFLLHSEIEKYFRSENGDYEKEIIGIKIEKYIESIPDSNSEISNWCDELKSLVNTIIGASDNIKDEYPNYYIEDYNMEYLSKLKLGIEVISN